MFIHNAPRSKNRYFSSVSIILLTVGIFSIIFQSCRKPSASEEPQISKGDKINVGQGETLIPYRWISPYSIKTVRAVRAMAAASGDSAVQSKLLQPLKSQNYQLYYKIVPNTQAKSQALSNWMDADTNHIAVTIPIDSISMYPHLFSENDLDRREETKTEFYTTVPINQPLPQTMQAVIIDTLYAPDSTERTLDFVLNLFTANLSNSFIQAAQTENQLMHQLIMNITDSNGFIPYTEVNGVRIISGGWDNPNPANPSNSSTFEWFKRAVHVYDGPGGSGTGRTWGIISTNGRITFQENTLGIQEGIRDLKVVALRFLLSKYTRRTDANGEFDSELPSWGFVTLDYRFENSEMRIRSLDVSDVLMGTVTSVGYFLGLNTVANHFKVIDPGSDPNDISVSFGHGTKAALWGITFNGVQEANDYATTDGIVGTGTYPLQYLNVMCYYNKYTNSASAPMMGHMYGVAGMANILLKLLGISGTIAGGGFFPDLVISMDKSNVLESQVIRATIYHEYAHSRHFFKANISSFDHWYKNVSSTLFDGTYGEEIDEDPGDFFSLSEGWADFIGNTYASRKYPAPREVREWTWNTEQTFTIYDETATWIEHLENNPTYYNSFIPRGMFHDLIDGGTGEFDFDRISGHTILQIYNELDDITWTIQQFRESWEDAHPSVNNALLFNEYSIGLP